MKPKLILQLALVLGGVSLAGSAAAQSSAKSEPSHGFPILPPITNANPSVRHPISVRVPTKLKIERTADTLSVQIDTNSFESTNLTIGTNMVTGVQVESFVYAVGEKRPGVRFFEGLDFNFFNLNSEVWHTKSGGIPFPGKKYVVEIDLVAFETDIPPQHEWMPQGSKNYKVLWRRTLKQTVDDTATFMQDILKKIEQQFPELGSLGRTHGTSSRTEVWNGEEYASGGFVLLKRPQIPSQRFSQGAETALSGFACHNLPLCFFWRRAT